MVYGQYEAALLFSDRHKAGARKMENRWSLIAKPTLKTMQRNYNMLDGRLNNEPPVRPDLTDGQTDEEIRELVPEAKPSLMDRLKADKPEHEARQMIPPVPERER